MKRFTVVLMALAIIVFAVSCSTTQASDVEPVVREVKISEFTAKEYNADQVYSMLERFVKDTYGDDEDVKVSYDKEAKAITISGLELSSNVGALAQDGWIEVDLKFDGAKASGIVVTPVPGTFAFGGKEIILHPGENRMEFFPRARRAE